MKEASNYQRLDDNSVRCLLCPHLCIIAIGKKGICGARQNENGVLVSRNYGVISGMAMDPIEKKPLYHFYPGSSILSVGTVGCNLKCPFCQNYQLSRYFDDSPSPRGVDIVNPNDLFQAAQKYQSRCIAYTYSEPSVWFEYVSDCARLFASTGVKNVLVTNGYINQKPLMELLPLISAANIDLKAFSEKNYQMLGGSLSQVLHTIETYKSSHVHIELTTLIVTDFNDNIIELENLVKWIANLDKKIPFHLSRYFPHYRYQKHATDREFLDEVAKMARSYLDYVYLGNVSEDSHTRCPSCGNLLVERNGFQTRITGIRENKCSKCGRIADFIL